MRLVVGPLPASVYWRRRAVVLGGAILAVLIVMYSCSRAGQTSPNANPTPTVPGPGSSSSPDSVVPVNQVSPTPSPEPVLDAQLCTDAELSVVAAPDKTTVGAGASFRIKLLIKNISSRACNRDVGADFQELRIVLGAEKIWSSDDCGGLTGSDLRTFPPNHERSYEVTWNGKSSTACSQATRPAPAGPAPEPGEYQIIGRVGTDLSDPVTLKLT